MILGTEGAEPEIVYFGLHMGQSNEESQAVAVRLGNTNWNYQGIGTGYPAVRVAQPVYSANPVGVYIYHKPTVGFDMSSEDGAWAAYQAGVNAARNVDFFGIELSMAVGIQQRTGKDVYIVKAAFPATDLAYFTAYSQAPGAWLYTNLEIAMQYYLKRAMRDFRTQNPTKRAVPLYISWGQGENDSENGRTSAQYQADFAILKTRVEEVICEEFVMPMGYSPLWIVRKLKFTINTGETAFNVVYDDIKAAYTNVEVVDPAPFPRKTDLTTPERLPSSGGYSDNTHMSYIAQLGCGELAVQKLIDRGMI